MPVLDGRHELKTRDGKPIFVIRTPNPITRTLLGVRFIDGEGYTQFESKAKRFIEDFGYDCILPKGHKGINLGVARTFEHDEDLVESPVAREMAVEAEEEEVV